MNEWQLVLRQADVFMKYIFSVFFLLLPLLWLNQVQVLNTHKVNYLDCGTELECGYDKTVFSRTFDSVWIFNKGLAIVEVKGKYRYINKSGEFAFPYKFDEARGFVRGFAGDLARVKYQGKWGFINRSGEFVIPPEFDFVWDFSEGLARAEKKGKEGYIDREYGKTKKFVILPKYEEAWDFSEGLAVVSKKIVLRNGRKRMYMTYINKKDEFAFPRVFISAWSFYEGLAVVLDRGGYRYINKSGEFAFPGTYKYAQEFIKGLAIVKIKNEEKWGFINKKGEFDIPPEFDSVAEFSGGLAVVAYNKKYGYIDREYGKTKKFIIPQNLLMLGPLREI